MKRVDERWGWKKGKEIRTVCEERSSGHEEEVKKNDTDNGGLEKLQSRRKKWHISFIGY